MRKNLFLVLGICLMIIGVVISYFADFQLADATGFATVMFGAGLAAATLWEKRNPESPILLPLIGIILIGAGAFILGFCGFAETTMTTIITSVFGLVAIIAGIIFSAIKKST